MEKLSQHRIDILGINAIVGPTVTLYELQPAPDVKISKIESYANDLKMATAAKGLRILAPFQVSLLWELRFLIPPARRFTLSK